jgi:hypothetical protein
MTEVNKIDSNVVGLRVANESTIGVLPGSTIWDAAEPNSYGDFGGSVTTIARNTINDSRQKKKGVVTDIEAQASFEADFTQDSHEKLLPGLFYAAYRKKADIENLTADTEISDVLTSTFTVASGGAAFLAGDLLWGAGFTNSGNNGLFNVASSTGTTIVVDEALTTEATVPLGAKLTVVGHLLGSAELDVDVSTGPLPRLLRASGTKDFTDFGLLPGEFIFVGGDNATNKFVTAANNGFARVRSVTATYIELDKSSATMVNETGTSLEIQLFFGQLLKNEVGSEIVRTTFQLERQLGAPDDSLPAQIQAEYVEGAILNEMTLTIPSAEKIITEMNFTANTHSTVDGPTSLKTGTRPTLVSGAAFNTSSDVTRIRMSTVSSTDSFPTALFAFVMDMSLTVNNNVGRNQAIGTIGNFEQTAGTFEVGGELTAYFTKVSAIAAVQANNDITLDVVLAKNNAGYVFDIPLITLSGGLAQVELNEPVKLPLTQEGADAVDVVSTMRHTMSIVKFRYLPTAAQ